MTRRQLEWWLWCVGSLLIAGSWFGYVSNTLGWWGFGIAMVGSAMSWGLIPPRSPGRSHEAKAETDDPDADVRR